MATASGRMRWPERGGRQPPCALAGGAWKLHDDFDMQSSPGLLVSARPFSKSARTDSIRPHVPISGPPSTVQRPCLVPSSLALTNEPGLVSGCGQRAKVDRAKTILNDQHVLLARRSLKRQTPYLKPDLNKDFTKHRLLDRSNYLQAPTRQDEFVVGSSARHQGSCPCYLSHVGLLLSQLPSLWSSCHPGPTLPRPGLLSVRKSSPNIHFIHDTQPVSTWTLVSACFPPGSIPCQHA